MRDIHPGVHKLINNVKKSFLKASFRVQVYKVLLGVLFPPEPIVIRWGTWVEVVMFTSKTIKV